MNKPRLQLSKSAGGIFLLTQLRSSEAANHYAPILIFAFERSSKQEHEESGPADVFITFTEKSTNLQLGAEKKEWKFVLNMTQGENWDAVSTTTETRRKSFSECRLISYRNRSQRNNGNSALIQMRSAYQLL